MPTWKRWGHPSQAILANISASKITINWWEEIKKINLMVERDLSELLSSNAMMMSSFMSPMNNNINNFTNDHNLQWQLWDAFRAWPCRHRHSSSSMHPHSNYLFLPWWVVPVRIVNLFQQVVLIGPKQAWSTIWLMLVLRVQWARPLVELKCMNYYHWMTWGGLRVGHDVNYK